MSRAEEFIGRPVRFSEAHRSEDVGCARGATLLVWLDRAMAESERSMLVRSLVAADPLAILIGGVDPEALFDELLGALDVEREPRLLLTKFSEHNRQQCAEEFLHATWPYDSRFDEWLAYEVISYGGPLLELRDAIRRALAT